MTIKMIILIIKKNFAKIKLLQNKKFSSKFEGKSECPHYTHVKHYGLKIFPLNYKTLFFKV